jgi:mannose-6-phosphate isomerase-like protein (cupin superfamily)
MDPAQPCAPASPAPLHGLQVSSAQVLVACDRLEPTLSFLQQQLGFAIDAIFPADDPRTAMLSGHGLQVRLVAGATRGASDIYLLCDPAPPAGTAPVVAPNGLRVHFSAATPALRQPATQQQLVLTRGDAPHAWGSGRAGMAYRDLVPGRLGGAFIASHIRIADGGPVPDYVHYHVIRFQAIFCRTGWVRVAYEGQGTALVMQPGDCVLQPPRIRHRVLESSAGAEVIEIAAPAEHITLADRSVALPDTVLQPGRDFDGQRFVFHQAATGSWAPSRIAGLLAQDTGIGHATGGLAGVRVLRPGPHAPVPSGSQSHASEFCFYFVLSGTVRLDVDGNSHRLARDDSITLPDRAHHAWSDASADLQLLEVTLPAEPGG